MFRPATKYCLLYPFTTLQSPVPSRSDAHLPRKQGSGPPGVCPREESTSVLVNKYPFPLRRLPARPRWRVETTSSPRRLPPPNLPNRTPGPREPSSSSVPRPIPRYGPHLLLKPRPHGDTPAGHRKIRSRARNRGASLSLLPSFRLSVPYPAFLLPLSPAPSQLQLPASKLHRLFSPPPHGCLPAYSEPLRSLPPSPCCLTGYRVASRLSGRLSVQLPAI